MKGFERMTDRIWRLQVPFEDLYTAVFLLRTAEGDLLADTATTESDVRERILPALHAGGFAPNRIFVSHRHGDHAGGLPYLAAALPHATLHMADPAGLPAHLAARTVRTADGMPLGEGITARRLPGHTADMTGLYDEASRTLLSFDGLQLFGIGRYGTSVEDLPAYLATLARLEQTAPAAIIASHEYVDLGAVAAGQAAAARYLARCRTALAALADFASQSGMRDPHAIAAHYRAQSTRPPVPPHTFAALQSK